jgi:hypothetical protein
MADIDECFAFILGDSRTSSKKTAKDTTNADDSDSLADSLGAEHFYRESDGPG